MIYISFVRTRILQGKYLISGTSPVTGPFSQVVLEPKEVVRLPCPYFIMLLLKVHESE
jgi:hypothetical protein